MVCPMPFKETTFAVCDGLGACPRIGISESTLTCSKSRNFKKISTAIYLISESTLTCEHYFLEIPKSLGERAFSDRLLGQVVTLVFIATFAQRKKTDSSVRSTYSPSRNSMWSITWLSGWKDTHYGCYIRILQDSWFRNRWIRRQGRSTCWPTLPLPA